MNDVGFHVKEGVATGNSPYKDPSKRNIGLLILATRGVPFSPRKVQSLDEYNTIFGGQNSSYYGPSIVKTLFEEAGDAKVTLYVARALGGAYLAAKVDDVALGAITVSAVASYKGEEDPGSWGNDVTAVLYSKGYMVKDSFYLVVKYQGEQVEQFSGTTLAELKSSVNKVSKYLTVDFSAELDPTYTELTGTVAGTTSSNVLTGTGTNFLTSVTKGNVLFEGSKVVGTVLSVDSDTKITLTSRSQVILSGATLKKRNDISATLSLSGGDDGDTAESDFYPGGTSANPTGFSCFDGYDVQILASTEFHSLSLAKALNEYVNTQKKPVGVINLPLLADEGTAELYAAELQTAGQSFLTGILGWVKVSDTSGNVIQTPALGAVLGAGYLRTPYLNGDDVHIPPAGIDSIFNTVIDVTPQRLTTAAINSIVRDFTCNVIKYVEDTGFYVGSSRTYSTNDLYASVHIRLQTTYYKEVLTRKLRYIEQKPNSPELKRQALIDLRTFFKGEYDKGALERSVSFDTAYKGICDKSNNPSTQNRRELNIDVLWIPTECTEAVGLSLKRNDSILTVAE